MYSTVPEYDVILSLRRWYRVTRVILNLALVGETLQDRQWVENANPRAHNERFDSEHCHSTDLL